MHSHLAKMIGQYILEERQKQDFLQKDLAAELEISPQFLGRIEKGEVMIPEPALLKAIEVLQLREDRLGKIFSSAANLEVSDLVSMIGKKKRRRA